MNSFAQELASQVPKFDMEILKGIKPEDSWVGTVTAGVWDIEQEWFEVREMVRKLVEGAAYAPTEQESKIDYFRVRA